MCLSVYLVLTHWLHLFQTVLILSQKGEKKKREFFPLVVFFSQKNQSVYRWSGKKGWNELLKNVQQDQRTVEQEAKFIYQMVCWATIGPNIPGAVNTIIKLVNSSVRDTSFLESFTRWLFWWGFSACDDVLLPWDVYGPNKEKVLKRLWALKKEI